YPDRHAFIVDVVAVEADLVRDAVAAGAPYIQFDEPAYLFFTQSHFLDPLAKLGVSRDSLLSECIAADQRVIAGLPEHVTTAVHFCRGNHKSRFLMSGPLDPVAEMMFSLPYDRFLLEWDDIKRQGDFSALRFVPKGGPIVVLGIISTKSPRIESED